MRDTQTCPPVKLTESVQISKNLIFWLVLRNSPVGVTYERTYRKNDAKKNALQVDMKQMWLRLSLCGEMMVQLYSADAPTFGGLKWKTWDVRR